MMCFFDQIVLFGTCCHWGFMLHAVHTRILQFGWCLIPQGMLYKHSLSSIGHPLERWRCIHRKSVMHVIYQNVWFYHVSSLPWLCLRNGKVCDKFLFDIVLPTWIPNSTQLTLSFLDSIALRLRCSPTILSFIHQHYDHYKPQESGRFIFLYVSVLRIEVNLG